MSAPTWIAGAGVAAVVAAPLSIVLLFSPPSQASCTDAPIVDVPAHQFSQQEISALWVRSGGSTDSTRVSRVGNVPDPVIAGAVGMAESGGDPGVVNSIGAGGLMQVHPPEPDYLDPGTNMHIAVRKWRAAHDHGGTGWEPWEAFTGSDGRGDDGPFRGRLPAVLGGATGAEGLAPPDCDTGGPVEGTPKHVIDTVVLAIARANGIERTVAENDAANARHGPTESGGRSDHQGPPDVAWAADMSNGVTTSEEDHLAAALAKRFGLEPLDLHTTGAAGSRQESSRTSGGYRIQLIYRSRLGGDHDDHVHLGVRKTGDPHDLSVPARLRGVGAAHLQGRGDRGVRHRRAACALGGRGVGVPGGVARYVALDRRAGPRGPALDRRSTRRADHRLRRRRAGRAAVLAVWQVV